MGNDVFANGREVSCKAADGKSICAFPDVCMTPPENPATPPGVPIPYPNTGMASDTTSGSKKVKVSGKEVMLKNKSYFKKSIGDEAGCAAKKGVVTSTNRGKVYFNSWSMDVKFEGENVIRHLDLTTHNHASQTGQTPPWPYLDELAVSKISECKDEVEKAHKKCGGKKGPPDCTKECKKAQKCILIPKGDDKKACCKPETTGHHLIEAHCFFRCDKDPLRGLEKYKYRKAPCVCASRQRCDGTHGLLHGVQGQLEKAYGNARKNPLRRWPGAGKKVTTGAYGISIREPKISKWTLKEATNAAVKAHQIVFRSSNCTANCIRKQLDAYHKDQCKFDDKTRLGTDPLSDVRSSSDDFTNQQKKAIKNITRSVKRTAKRI